MTPEILAEKILFLDPDAKFTVWNIKEGSQYYGETKPIEMFGYLIDWLPSNQRECPSVQMIDGIDQKQYEKSLSDKTKKLRNDNCANDLSLVAAFNNARIARPDLSFSDYLDEVEALQKQIKAP